MKNNIYTIEDLAQGKCAVINDGSLEELREVLSEAFPKEKCNVGGFKRYYFKMRDTHTEWDCSDHTQHIPTQSVKDFLKQIEYKFKVGDFVEYINHDEFEDKILKITSIDENRILAQCPELMYSASGESKYFIPHFRRLERLVVIEECLGLKVNQIITLTGDNDCDGLYIPKTDRKKFAILRSTPEKGAGVKPDVYQAGIDPVNLESSKEENKLQEASVYKSINGVIVNAKVVEEVFGTKKEIEHNPSFVIDYDLYDKDILEKYIKELREKNSSLAQAFEKEKFDHYELHDEMRGKINEIKDLERKIAEKEDLILKLERDVDSLKKSIENKYQKNSQKEEGQIDEHELSVKILDVVHQTNVKIQESIEQQIKELSTLWKEKNFKKIK